MSTVETKTRTNGKNIRPAGKKVAASSKEKGVVASKPAKDGLMGLNWKAVAAFIAFLGMVAFLYNPNIPQGDSAKKSGKPGGVFASGLTAK
ncbi:MAG: hypothetical protein COV67_04195 [Nitrospinae bacterium CG11_big_fil_rev_8_21_14_0_20_56_8]|nr:MAG: hypothetical protein COV67_04195 [Nitrospinae bacterium CG11_big_fil_rev_8_21_14_0_20_56_8]